MGFGQESDTAFSKGKNKFWNKNTQVHIQIHVFALQLFVDQRG